MKCSVIICTHNPREAYLKRVIDGLKKQALATHQWELILVDNASQPALTNRFDLSWHINGRCVLEEETGLTYARLKGISEAKTELLIFVDDDNILNPDYLDNAIKIGVAHPWLGTWSGNAMPEYEVFPTEEIRRHLGCIAVTLNRETKSSWAKVSYYVPALPFGAGMCVRKIVAEHYAKCVSEDPLRKKLDRSGKMLGAGGDHDIYFTSVEIGLGGGLFPELELTHLIPARRLQLNYLAGIRQGQGYATVVLGAIHQPSYMPPIQRKRRLYFEWLRLMFKKKTDRVLALANYKGQFEAYLDLKQLGYFE